ncbi:ABC transporter substrate-binding protein [Deltaproteobacteria bacterium]|nr:ABC transporter substrate-binding protein [Deltaproteobacteria bacterium]
MPTRYFLAKLAVLFLLLVPCGAEAADARPNIIIAVAENPATLEPAQELSNVGTRITYNVYDTLIRRDFLADGSGTAAVLAPHLAESWKRIPGNGLELVLRKGVRFHNGDELTAEDAVFTFARLLAPDTPLQEARAYFIGFERLEAVSPYIMRIYTKNYDPLLEHRLSSWASWIVNKKAYQSMGMAAFSKKPVGTGPFKVKAVIPGERIELESFDDYFMGRPTAKNLTFTVVPEVAARMSGLVSGQFSMAVNIPPDQLDLLSSYPDIDVRSIVLANSHLLVFNTSHPILKDKRVRQALSLSIDRQALNKALWHNKAVVPLNYQYPEFGPLYEPDRKGYVYDPEKASALLKEAGYKGETITYHTQSGYYLNSLAAAQIMLEMWKKAGINVDLKVIENWKQVRDEDIMIRNWSNSVRYPDPAGCLWMNWSPLSNPQRLWKTWDKESAAKFNALGETLDRTADMKERKAVTQALIDEWDDAAPATILYQPLESYAVRKNIEWKPYSFYYMDFRPYNLRIGK